MFNETLARALRRLSDATTREVALLRMESYQNREIADRLEISLSSVERKLRVIRELQLADRQKMREVGQPSATYR